MVTLRNRKKEKAITFLRLLTITFCIVFMYLLLLVRLYHLQIQMHPHFLSLSNNNQYSYSSLEPYRANIIDRNNQPLAHYRTTFRLKIEPKPVDEEKLNYLETLVSISKSDHENILSGKGFLSSNLDFEQYAHLINSEGPFSIITKEVRSYPYNEASGHLIGYLGTPSSKEKTFPENQTGISRIGKTGIEKQYNHYLSGVKGKIAKEVNARGVVMQNNIINPPIRHKPLQLTIDAELQNTAYNALYGHTGSVVALDPNSGEVLILASNPGYDPNKVTAPDKAHTRNIDHEDQPLFYRSIQSTYAPASTIKPFIALMALEDNLINPTDTIEDNGYFLIKEDTRRFHDWKRSGHGTVDLHEAITLSCDTYFYHLANRLGIDRLTQYFSAFKMGEPTNIDLPSEALGMIPNTQYRQKRNKPWYQGETIITGIGEGPFLVTPLQLARATMLLANKGYDHPLHLLKGAQNTPKKILNISDNNWHIITNAMRDVMKRGTARSFGHTNYEVAGKTGSGQVATLHNRSTYHSLPKKMKDNNLFIGFSPIKNPQIVVVVIIEHEHEALKVAKTVLDKFWMQNHTNDTGKLDPNRPA